MGKALGMGFGLVIPLGKALGKALGRAPGQATISLRPGGLIGFGICCNRFGGLASARLLLRLRNRCLQQAAVEAAVTVTSDLLAAVLP